LIALEAQTTTAAVDNSEIIACGPVQAGIGGTGIRLVLAIRTRISVSTLASMRHTLVYANATIVAKTRN